MNLGDLKIISDLLGAQYGSQFHLLPLRQKFAARSALKTFEIWIGPEG